MHGTTIKVKDINTLFKKKNHNLLMLEQVVRITTTTIKGLIITNDLKGRNRCLFEIRIKLQFVRKDNKEGSVNQVIPLCIDSLYSLYYIYIYIYTFQSTQLYNKSTG